MRKPLTDYLTERPKRHSTFQLQIEQAASGCISGYLREWPVLQSALAYEGLILSDDTLSPTLKKICQMILELDKAAELEADVIRLFSDLAGQEATDLLAKLDSNDQNG